MHHSFFYDYILILKKIQQILTKRQYSYTIRLKRYKTKIHYSIKYVHGIDFAKQAVREQRIPFNLSRNVPNAETITAIEEVERMKLNPQAYKGYDNVDEMMRELLK